MTPSTHPAALTYLGVPGYAYGWAMLVIGLGLFAWILSRRYRILSAGQSDPRFTSIGQRLTGLVTYGLIQKRQPRFLWAGIIHILIFWGFMVLGIRSMDLITQSIGLPLLRPILEGAFGTFYGGLKDVFELLVLGACLWAILRRAVLKPARYKGSHQFEAFLVLGLISFLMVTDMFYEGSGLLLLGGDGGWLPASRSAAFLLSGSSSPFLRSIHNGCFWFHLLAFFFFLNFLPLGKHFHIITALPNVFFRRLTKGSLKPARWGVEDIEELESLGVEKFEDFTWKHILDFFTCTECGRCSDMCPANAVGRPLSPKLLTMKLRDHGYRKYPVFGSGKEKEDGSALVGDLITFEEIWSCTTCGACEEECPVFIEYIDKIVDMRRNLIETSRNPKSFNQVLMHFEKTGNPFGKPPAKRAEWTEELREEVPVKILEEGDEVDVLFFVDSYGSFDPAVQDIAANIARGLHRAGVDFGILGPLETDTGHQVRRMGEEGLFQFLVETNLETLKSIRFNRIVTLDPHAFNTLLKDYPARWEVRHYVPFFLSLLERGAIKPIRPLEGNNTYTYHDPCYLGRHNGIYDEPRRLLQALPGMNLVEMERRRDRSFCCGGGDIILWHEIEQEEERMASRRITMAREVGADTIVTACPFCLIHFEDAIKTGGLEEQMRVVDLMALLLSTL
ncbi:MAG: (Fe-S)-binding protein [Deltaproteobacteria bacterium]|nr:(Fe-S)-binding protein [Deltaproteobacteria bacterium]